MKTTIPSHATAILDALHFSRQLLGKHFAITDTGITDSCVGNCLSESQVLDFPVIRISLLNPGSF